MPTNDQANQKVDFLYIDCESNYFNTQEQVKLQRTRHFTETTIASKVSGSNSVSGLFSRKRVVKDDAIYNSDVYLTSSTNIDNSGGSRKILALNINYYASSSYDAYRTGVEITQDKHWVEGLSKISAGTPGHLYDSLRYGISDTSVISEDQYIEIDPFDPVQYVATGGDPELVTFPIITGDFNQIENFILNGIIEPFPIRPVISNFSINFPFEPHSVKSEFGTGNSNTRFASDQVLSIDEYSPQIETNSPFLDAVDMVSLSTGDTSVFIGPSLGYFTMDENKMTPYVEELTPRGEPISSSYGDQLAAAVSQFPQQGTTYMSRKEKSGTAGFVFDNAYKGTDSIAYGGLLY